jgi:hypothetical protein
VKPVSSASLTALSAERTMATPLGTVQMWRAAAPSAARAVSAVRGVVATLVVLAGACHGPLPRFDIDIEVTEGRTERGEPAPDERIVGIALVDLGAGCVRDSWRRPEPGHCGETSDAREPPCGTWHCLREIRVESPGGVLARVEVDASRDYTQVALRVPARARDARVVLEGCRTSAEVPVSLELPSAPEVTRATRLTDGYEVAWTGAEDAAMIEVSSGSGFGGPVCAQRERTPVKFSVWAMDAFSGLAARSAIVERATPFGTAHIWRLSHTRFEAGLFPGDNSVRFTAVVLVERADAGAPLSVEVRLNADLDGESCKSWPPDPYECRPADGANTRQCERAACASGLRLEVDGVRAVGLDQLHDRRGVRPPFRLELPTVPPGARVELVIEGCGRDSARVVLPTEPLAAPTLSRVLQDGDDFRFEWEGAPGATSALATVTGRMPGQICHSYGRGAALVHAPGGHPQGATLRAVAASEPVDTSFGRVRIWRVSPPVQPSAP